MMERLIWKEDSEMIGTKSHQELQLFKYPIKF